MVRGPREDEPTIHGTGWVAWATSPDEARLQGAGGSPEDALQQLTVYLREFRTAALTQS